MKSENIIKGSTNSAIFPYKVEEQEQNNDEMINEIIFKTYQIKKKIGKTLTIDLYDGINLENNKPVLIKIEKKTKEKILLEEEAYNLYSFKGFGIPELIKIGIRKNNIILIESKKGRSLEELFLENNKKFSLNEICLIGIQCFERLKWIHSKNYIHRNIKPGNFAIGLEDPHIFYLQNFYYCQKYRSSKTHQHIKLKYIKEIIGTERYASINALKGLTQGRKDDLESLCYMLIYFFLGKLPWQDIREENNIKKHEKLLKEKKNFQIENYKQIPEDFCILFKYIKNLKFEEEPKYSLIIKILQKILNENNCFNTNIFFWNRNNNNNHQEANIKMKKEGFRERLYEKIQKTSKTENECFFYGKKVKNKDVTIENMGLGYIDDEDDFEENENKIYKVENDNQVKIKRVSYDESKKENEEENNENKEYDLNKSNSSINTKVYKLTGPLEYFIRNENKNDLKDTDEINSKEVEKILQNENKDKVIIVSKKTYFNNEIIKEESLNEEGDDKNNKDKINEIYEGPDNIYTSDYKSKEKSSGISNNLKQESTKESIQNNISTNKIENFENHKNNGNIVIAKNNDNKFIGIKGDERQKKRSNSLINNYEKERKKQKNKDCIIF